jgi:hypothetical protein
MSAAMIPLVYLGAWMNTSLRFLGGFWAGWVEKQHWHIKQHRIMNPRIEPPTINPSINAMTPSGALQRRA